MSLSSAEEVYRYIGGTFESAMKDPRLGPKLTHRKLRVRLGFVDPDCVLHIDTENAQVRADRGFDSDPSLVVAMGAETANRYCQGKVDVTSAVQRGEIVTKGDIEGLLELSPLQADFARLYVDRLKRDGRGDLIVDGRGDSKGELEPGSGHYRLLCSSTAR